MNAVITWLKKAGLVVALAGMMVTAWVPNLSVQALGATDPGTTPTPPPFGGEFLEKAWAREQTAYAKLDNFFANIDQRLAKGQQLIDKAKANGKDVTALQAALDAFSAAVKQARPIYESGKGILTSHKGFDDSGKVTDPVQAFQTVWDLRSKLMQIRQLLVAPGQALRDAIRAFRQANQPAGTATPAP